ncbi:MAG: UDP-3-O-[3-hydroxymyristoyl] N-acetylglucosamine deacetylase [Nitrospinae bacterium]|nr:UDP-3-O-[3-hydroxymyristoyl] N-acetylglucosamine deacetylase [Nitrospinota bacterium]
MKKGRIVVVDDEENIRGAIKDILTDEGYDVECAADGETALRMIQSVTPDLVLLDIWMPGLDGLQTLKILKNIDADTEVVMMSGHGAIETAVKATKIGAFDFIEKPFSLDSMLRTVGKALRSRRSRRRNGGAQLFSNAGLFEGRFIGSSRAAREARRLIREASQRPGGVIICGEAGLGKKFAARMIHNLSSRRDKPFVEIACDSLTEEDLAEAGGHDKDSAWSGAAEGGSLFFNKIDKLSPEMAAGLLQVIENMQAGDGEAPVFIASSEKSFEELKGGGKPWEELLSVLGGAVIRLWPLRGRREDIPAFVERFVEEYCDEYGKNIEGVDKEAMNEILSMPLSGNIKELKGIVEQAAALCEGETLGRKQLLMPSQNADGAGSHHPSGGNILSGGSAEGRKSGLSRQRTLKNSVVLCGHGLHSGIKTGMILSPLPPNSGIVFGDISTGLRVPALLENVRSTEYATTLSNGLVTIKTIEHIMSALHSYRITNLLIKIGDEAPIMDGSAIDFCQLIEDSGVEEQEGYVDEIVITGEVSVGDPEEGPYLRVEPAPVFEVDYFLDYPQPIGRQEHRYVYESGAHYKETIAPARTFGFVRDIKKLEEAGLAGGGKLSNFILIDDEKIVNTPLRFPNEPARHKILDLIGDLYLLGRPIRGKFTARKSGHSQNVAIIQKIRERMEEAVAADGGR